MVAVRSRDHRRVPFRAPPQEVIDLAPPAIVQAFAEFQRLTGALDEARVGLVAAEDSAKRIERDSIERMAEAYRDGAETPDSDEPERARVRADQARRRVDALEQAVSAARDDVVFVVHEHGDAWAEAAIEKTRGAVEAARELLIEFEASLVDTTLSVSVMGFITDVERKPVYVSRGLYAPVFDYQGSVTDVLRPDAAIDTLTRLLREADEVNARPQPEPDPSPDDDTTDADGSAPGVDPEVEADLGIEVS